MPSAEKPRRRCFSTVRCPTTVERLPTGLTLDPTTGVFRGAPTQAGTFPVTIGTTNAAGMSAPANLVFTVAKATPVSTSGSVGRGQVANFDFLGARNVSARCGPPRPGLISLGRRRVPRRLRD